MRCANCDRPLATQADHDTIAEGDGEHLCWSRYSSACESIDWRARALEARAERDAIAAQLAALHKVASRAAAWVLGTGADSTHQRLGKALADLRGALYDTAAAAEAHDREVRARAWEAADALLDAEGPGRVYHERLLRARAAEERGR